MAEKVKRLSKVIYEVNGKDTFVKVKNNSFEIEKAVFSFVKYDESNKKCQQSGDYYLSFADCMSLYRDIDKGLLQRDVRNELERCKKENQKYAKAVRQFQGGVPEEKAGRNDKLATARIFSIEPGTKYPYVLKYTEGPAKTNPTNKLITPLWWSDKTYKADFQILVPCSEEDIMKLALLLHSHIQGYISSCYTTDKYMADYDEKGKQKASTTSQESAGQNAGRAAGKSKPHTTASPVVTKKNETKQEEGVTSDKRAMKVVFTTLPTYIEDTEGLYTSEVSVKGKTLSIYYTSDVYKKYVEQIKEASKAQKEIGIQYVIVQDPTDAKLKFTYFMGFA